MHLGKHCPINAASNGLVKTIFKDCYADFESPVIFPEVVNDADRQEMSFYCDMLNGFHKYFTIILGKHLQEQQVRLKCGSITVQYFGRLVVTTAYTKMILATIISVCMSSLMLMQHSQVYQGYVLK